MPTATTATTPKERLHTTADHGRSLVPFALAVTLSFLVSRRLAADSYITLYLFVLFLLPALILVRRGVPRVFRFVLGAAVGFLYFFAYQQLYYLPITALANQTMRLEAEVVSFPEAGDYSLLVEVQRDDVRNTPISLSLPQRPDYAALTPGDRLSAVVYLTAAHSAEDGFGDLRSSGVYLFSESHGLTEIHTNEVVLGLAAAGFLSRLLEPRLHHTPDETRPLQPLGAMLQDLAPLAKDAAQFVQDIPGTQNLVSAGSPHIGTVPYIPPAHLQTYLAKALNERIHRLYEGETGALLSALLLGDQSGIDGDTREALSRTGLSHVIAVSGLHIGFLSGALSHILPRNRPFPVLLQISLLFGFAVLAGGSPGALRAAFLCAASLAAPLLRRQYDPPSGLCAALLLLLFQNPYAVMHLGLQLSFAATLGIFLISLPLTKHCCQGLVKKRLLRRAISLFFLSFGANLFTIPFLALYFGSLSLAATVANLLTNLLIVASFLLGMLSLLFALIVPPLAVVFAIPTDWCMRLFVFIAEEISRLPFSALSLSSVYYRVFLVFFYAVVLYALYWALRQKIRLVIPLFAITCTFCLSLLLTSASYVQENLVFTALDVGQGQSLALYASGTPVLIDCGGTKEAGHIAADYFGATGQSEIPLVILTHTDADHANGLASLISRMKVGAILASSAATTQESGAAVFALAEMENIPVYLVQECLEIPLEAGLLTVFPSLSTESTNASSLSVLVESGEFAALITGDMPQETEALLLSDYEIPQLGVLVAGHHGASDATSGQLLSETNPMYTIISSGENNFGHPAPETIERLLANDSKILETRRLGSISLFIDE